MGGVLTNMVGFDRAKALSKKKSPLSLQTMAVGFSESVGEVLWQISRWLHQRANRKWKPVGIDRKKKIEFRISKLKFESNFCRVWIGRAKQRSSTVGLGNCVGCRFRCEV